MASGSQVSVKSIAAYLSRKFQLNVRHCRSRDKTQLPCATPAYVNPSVGQIAHELFNVSKNDQATSFDAT